LNYYAGAILFYPNYSDPVEKTWTHDLDEQHRNMDKSTNDWFAEKSRG